jgi:dipeptidyl aminopeptidase/acylaminoacyl peptidase
MRVTVSSCFAIFLATAFLGAADVGPAPKDAPSYHLRVASYEETFLIRPDAAEKAVTPIDAPAYSPFQSLSPDGTRVADIPDDRKSFQILDTKGKELALVNVDKPVARATWSADNKRLAFHALIGDTWQPYTMTRDGKEVTQVTKEPHGVRDLQFSPDGRLSYFAKHASRVDVHDADLVILGPGDQRTILVKNTKFLAHAWSPDGKTIAYSTIGQLIFLDPAASKSTTIDLTSINRTLGNSGAVYLTWRPDSKAIACAILYMHARGTQKRLGDGEAFIIPREGKATWFDIGREPKDFEWVEAKK